MGRSTVPWSSWRQAVHQGEIAAADGMRLELAGKMVVRGVVLGGDQHPRGILVEAMDDAGPQFAADAGEILAVMQQGVDQGAPLVPGAGCTTRPAGLSMTIRCGSS